MTERARRRLAAHAAAIAVILLGALRWRYPGIRFYPGCPVLRLLHVRCPGCGGTRAVAALLHGHLGEALRWNALVVFALPFLLAYAGIVYWRLVGAEEFRWPEVRPAVSFGGVALVLSFAVMRDLVGP